MVTSLHKVTCPLCGKVNDYEVAKMELIDVDLHVSYQCACGCVFTDEYALVYLGGHTAELSYDRDNLIKDR